MTSTYQNKAYELHIDDNKDLYFLSPRGKEVGAVAFYYTSYEDVVYLPNIPELTTLIVNGCPKQEFTKLPILSDELFDELNELFDIKDCTKSALYDFTSHWFAKWCRAQNTYGAYTLSYEGYSLLYYHLSDAYDLDSAVKDFPAIANSYLDCDAEHILFLANIETEDEDGAQLSENEQMDLALNYLLENGIFYDTFEADGNQLFLVSAF